MDWNQALLLMLAGIGTGIVGYGAGLASLVSYPALLATGLSPLAANLTNTVAVSFSAVGGLLTSGPELRPQRARVLHFAVAGTVGGAGGAVLLLSTPPGTFAALVPWLIALASVALLARPWLQRLRMPATHRHLGMNVFVAVVAVYGGYFGAAAGVVLLAGFGAVLRDPYRMLNALKSVVVGAANLAASVIFAVLSVLGRAPVDWGSAVPLALGCLIGAVVSPPIVRRLPETGLRVGVGLAGLCLAGYLYLG